MRGRQGEARHCGTAVLPLFLQAPGGAPRHLRPKEARQFEMAVLERGPVDGTCLRERTQVGVESKRPQQRLVVEDA